MFFERVGEGTKAAVARGEGAVRDAHPVVHDLFDAALDA